MGHIKEPAGVDLVVNPMPLSIQDREVISAIIANYKRSGEMPKPVEKQKALAKKITAVAKGNATKVKSSGVKKVTAA